MKGLPQFAAGLFISKKKNCHDIVCYRVFAKRVFAVRILSLPGISQINNLECNIDTESGMNKMMDNIIRIVETQIIIYK